MEFFGFRNLVWDKHQQLARIESLRIQLLMLLIEKSFRESLVKDQLITERDSLNKMLQKAKAYGSTILTGWLCRLN